MNSIKLSFLLILTFTVSSLAQDLPPIKLDYASYTLSGDGKLIGYFGNQRRIEVKSTSEVSKYVLWCLIATEDRDFYNHDGVSYKGLVRGILKTITGETQGGSTLTMQLARNLFLSHEKSLGRKINEIDLARKLEQKFSKDQLLLLYLNTVYFGRGSHGIWAASQEYFQKTPKQLNITESAVLVGLLQSPSGYDPEKNPVKLLNRRNEVLDNLVEVGKLSKQEYQKLKNTSLDLNLRNNTGRHFLEHIRKEAVRILNSKGLKLSNDQLKITTTLDYRLQEIAEENVEEQWNSLPEKIKKEMQVGIISIDPSNGYIKAMVGGNPDSEGRGLNRTVQIKRQPGSSFKPFLYGAMIEQGYTLGTPLLDSPIVLDRNKPTEWRPSNSDESYSETYIPLISAVQNSINLAAAYAISHYTNPDSVILFANKCGINSYIPPYYSISLGTAEVSPLEMASGYGVFSSYGNYSEPVSIIKIEDKNGKVIYQSQTNHRNVVDSADCYLLTKALQTVTDFGTASSVRKYYRGFAAGKTGTTQNSTDVWFVGYTTNLSTAIWMGYDSPKRKLSGGMQYGGTACAPLWGKIMGEYYGKTAASKTNGAPPYSIHEIQICTASGERASENCIDKKLYPVNLRKIPSYCHIHPPVEKFDIYHSF